MTNREQNTEVIITDDGEYYMVGWEAHVRDNAGNYKYYSSLIGLKARYFQPLVTNGPTKAAAIMFISKQGRKAVFSEGIDWRCTTCGDRATTCVTVSASLKLPPPRIAEELAFKTICGKVMCEYKANKDMHEEMEKIQSERNISHLTLTVCGNCFSVEKGRGVKMSMCSRCRMVHYCSQECQKKDWKVHKIRCRQVPKDEA